MNKSNFTCFAICFSFTFFCTNTAFGQVKCEAIFRTLDSQNQTIEKRISLKVALDTPTVTKQEADLEDHNFSLIQDKPKNDFFAQITSGPDYTKGTVYRGAADSLGRFTATEVDGATIYRLECNESKK